MYNNIPQHIYVWEIDNFVINRDIFRDFSIVKIFLVTLSCYHDDYFKYLMFEKYNGFVSNAKVSACTYFLVNRLMRGVVACM